MTGKELSTFEKEVKALQSSEAMKEFTDAAANLKTGGGELKRISLRGSKFRKIVNGEELAVSRESSMMVVIVNAAPISRLYYSGSYDPNKLAAPVCWSGDTNKGVPSPDVPEETKQASRCADCPQNIKGSGQGNSKACRYQQRLAVITDGDYESVYQLSLPATSLFGEGEGGKMPLNMYMRYLDQFKIPPNVVVTEMYFDDDADVPKLYFKPVRTLEDHELEQVRPLLSAPQTLRCVELSVAEMDGVKSAPKLPSKVEEPEEVPEPKKAKKAKQAEPEPTDTDLDAALDEWDD